LKYEKWCNPKGLLQRIKIIFLTQCNVAKDLKNLGVLPSFMHWDKIVVQDFSNNINMSSQVELNGHVEFHRPKIRGY
jgi:hypothetical protein